MAEIARTLATEALPDAPVRTDRKQSHRVRRVAARALASTANRREPAAARAGLAN